MANNNTKFLVECKTTAGTVHTFGPFDSLKRAEETLVKVCEGFREGDILIASARGIRSLTKELFSHCTNLDLKEEENDS